MMHEVPSREGKKSRIISVRILVWEDGFWELVDGEPKFGEIS